MIFCKSQKSPHSGAGRSVSFKYINLWLEMREGCHVVWKTRTAVRCQIIRAGQSDRVSRPSPPNVSRVSNRFSSLPGSVLPLMPPCLSKPIPVSINKGKIWPKMSFYSAPLFTCVWSVHRFTDAYFPILATTVLWEYRRRKKSSTMASTCCVEGGFFFCWCGCIFILYFQLHCFNVGWWFAWFKIIHPIQWNPSNHPLL